MRKLLLPLMLACASCTTDAGSPSAPPQPAPVAKSVQGVERGGTIGQIRAMIGAAACTDSSQCRTLPLGARGCGGPEAYLPYSTAKDSETALQALGERYKQERQAQNLASGAISDCRFMVDPGAVCQAGSCQLVPGGPQIR